MTSRHAPDDHLLDDDDLDPHNPYASATRWRHQESSAFRRHAAAQPGSQHGHAAAREPEARGRVNDLADFLNSSRVSPGETKQHEKPGTPKFKPIMVGAAEARDATTGSRPASALPTSQESPPDQREISVGPLLNYRRMEGDTWFGSVLVVVKGGGKTQAFVPTLLLRPAGQGSGENLVNGTDNGEASTAGGSSSKGGAEVRGLCLYSDPRNTFWRFDLSIQLQQTEAKWEYTLPDLRFASKKKPQRSSFHVPAITESFRIMFYSCNGFSVGTDEDAWSGAALWNDVMRRHSEAPFHVMIGGGDQIYNDSIRVSGPLKAWTDIGNPKKRRDYPFPEKLRQACDDFYLQNYIRWYGTEPFASANGQIPQLNIWDDHDIIDGFGSYVNDFMKCDVFRGIGGTAHKYYMLFQHHLPPPPSTYTSDAIVSSPLEEGQAVDPNQLFDTYVHPAMTESNYIVGSKPGPYVAEHSHSIFAKLGARVAFLGVDARTERTRHQVNYPETYEQIFDRLHQELGSAAKSGNPYKHLILLLGIPIAYPRLTWLENIFKSPIVGPIKFLNRRFGIGGAIFNKFDGSIDLLDDLDDHYTARIHKKERNALVTRLQTICAEFNVRITILGGDVHLAAVGRFYSNPQLRIPSENDHRYIVNVVSSAIVNKPPPSVIANLLARRNKIHHLDHDTDETLMNLFDKDPDNSSFTANYNHATMPSRNFAMITENSPHNLNAPRRDQPDASLSNGNQANGGSGSGSGSSSGGSTGASFKFPGKDGHTPLHAGEVDAGTSHKAASSTEHGKGNDGSLDVCIRVEIDQHDREGRTQGYGLTIPVLDYKPAPAPH